MIYFEIKEEYIKYIKKIFKKLLEVRMHLKLENRVAIGSA